MKGRGGSGISQAVVPPACLLTPVFLVGLCGFGFFLNLCRASFQEPLLTAQKCSGDPGDCTPPSKGFSDSDLALFGSEGASWGQDLQL